MKTYPVSSSLINSRSNSNNNNNNDYKRRLMLMSSGICIGTAASLVYYSGKNLPKKSLWLKSLEAGAALGLFADIFDMTINIPQKIHPAQKTNTDNINYSLLKNKDFFINLYTGNENDIENFDKYKKLFADKNSCDKLFKDKDILKASQEALLEINQRKITELSLTGNNEEINDLKVVNSLIEKALENQDKNNTSLKEQNSVNFKGIFDFFHSGGESMKKRAEISVNRYATSAAATAAALANTGFGDALALTIITKNMCKKIFKIYNCNGGYISAVAAAAAGSVLGTNLASKGITMFPGAGNAVNATITYSLHQLEGRALIEFLEENSSKLSGMSDADVVAKFAYKTKMGLNTIENDKVRDILGKVIDTSFDIFL